MRKFLFYSVLIGLFLLQMSCMDNLDEPWFLTCKFVNHDDPNICQFDIIHKGFYPEEGLWQLKNRFQRIIDSSYVYNDTLDTYEAYPVCYQYVAVSIAKTNGLWDPTDPLSTDKAFVLPVDTIRVKEDLHVEFHWPTDTLKAVKKIIFYGSILEVVEEIEEDNNEK